MLLYLVERAAPDHPHLVRLLRQLRVHQPESRGQVLGQMVSSCRGLSGGEDILNIQQAALNVNPHLQTPELNLPQPPQPLKIEIQFRINNKQLWFEDSPGNSD